MLYSHAPLKWGDGRREGRRRGERKAHMGGWRGRPPALARQCRARGKKQGEGGVQRGAKGPVARRPPRRPCRRHHDYRVEDCRCTCRRRGVCWCSAPPPPPPLSPRVLAAVAASRHTRGRVLGLGINILRRENAAIAHRRAISPASGICARVNARVGAGGVEGHGGGERLGGCIIGVCVAMLRAKRVFPWHI